VRAGTDTPNGSAHRAEELRPPTTPDPHRKLNRESFGVSNFPPVSAEGYTWRVSNPPASAPHPAVPQGFRCKPL